MINNNQKLKFLKFPTMTKDKSGAWITCYHSFESLYGKIIAFLNRQIMKSSIEQTVILY